MNETVSDYILSLILVTPRRIAYKVADDAKKDCQLVPFEVRGDNVLSTSSVGLPQWDVSKDMKTIFYRLMK